MPSPFPGMDPYLEDPHYWPGFHQPFITHLCGAINERLPESYVAIINERLLVGEERTIYPDIGVRDRAASPSRGLIELLSPANKSGKSHGNEKYLKKQRETLRSETHLLEIDLLRWGVHTVAAPLYLLADKGHWEYLVSLSRSWNRLHWQAWPILLRHRLPRIAIPLKEGEAEVSVDLQEAMDRVYDQGAFRKILHYDRDPWPGLDGKDKVWAETLLVDKKFRSP